MTDRNTARRAALLRLLDGPTSTRHHNMADSKVMRDLLREGLVDYLRSWGGMPLLLLVLTPRGLAAARAIKERQNGS